MSVECDVCGCQVDLDATDSGMRILRAAEGSGLSEEQCVAAIEGRKGGEGMNIKIDKATYALIAVKKSVHGPAGTMIAAGSKKDLKLHPAVALGEIRNVILQDVVPVDK